MVNGGVGVLRSADCSDRVFTSGLMGVGEGAGGFAVGGLETGLGIGLEDEQPMVRVWEKDVGFGLVEKGWTVLLGGTF